MFRKYLKEVVNNFYSLSVYLVRVFLMIIQIETKNSGRLTKSKCCQCLLMLLEVWSEIRLT